MQRIFSHEYAADDDHCRDAVLRDLPGDLPATLAAAVASYRRGGSLEEIEGVLERLDASEHDQDTHDACLELRELLDLHLRACSCQEEEWYAFEANLSADLLRYGDPGWAIRTSQGPSPYELAPYELSLGDLQDYGVSLNNDICVTGDTQSLTVSVNGEERAQFVPILSDRETLYEALVDIGHDEPFRHALAAPPALLGICELVAAALSGTGVWLPAGGEDATTWLSTEDLPELSGAELEVARGLAHSWAGSLAELFAAAQGCVLTA